MPRLSVDIDLDLAKIAVEEMIKARKNINDEILAYMSNEDMF